MGRVQLAAINKPASCASWCPAISTQLVNSSDCDDVITQVKELAVGDDHPIIISFDLTLYEKVVQFFDSRPDGQALFVPRMGELHVDMASLRALGTSIETKV